MLTWGTPNFYSVVRSAADFNPHCALTAIAPGQPPRHFHPTHSNWQHWRPDRPTAPHWYTLERFRALVALLLNVERHGGKARSVNELIRDFYGLSGTAKAKAIAQAAGLTGAMLRDLANGDDLDTDLLSALLTAMQQAARPVKPDMLGVLGQAHCVDRLQRYGATADSIEYRRAQGEANGLPYSLEVAFGVKADSEQIRTLSIGINFSPALEQPFSELDAMLSEARCTWRDPAAMLVHLACPLVQFSDRGKARAVLPAAITADLQRLVKSVTARFTKAKRQADKNDRMGTRDLEALRTAHKAKPLSVKAAAWQVMEQAYLKASSGGTLPANARQIMYAARPLIIELTGKATPWKDSSTFTQQYLPDYLNAHPDQCWDVVFDDRGHFAEPHTGRRIGVGTLAVRGYIGSWESEVATPDLDSPDALDTTLDTCGPALRYRFALFVEKEGFNPLLEQARIAERYDLALLSTKGMSVTAARKLIDELSSEGVTTLVLHDFDKSGFTIWHTLKTDNRRYTFKTAPKMIDLGLRLADVLEMNLDSEAVEYSGDTDPRLKLIEQGATPEEADYLAAGKNDGRWIGQRVELNAMSAQQFLDWLERALKNHGVKKFIPDAEAIKAAWKRAWRITELNKAIAKVAKDLPEPPEPSSDLLDRVRTQLDKCPEQGWDAVLIEEPEPEIEALAQLPRNNEGQSPDGTGLV